MGKNFESSIQQLTAGESNGARSPTLTEKPRPNEQSNSWYLGYVSGEIDVSSSSDFPDESENDSPEFSEYVTELMLDSANDLQTEASAYCDYASCPHCSSALVKLTRCFSGDKYHWRDFNFGWCRHCAFWFYKCNEEEGENPESSETLRTTGAISRLRTFSPVMPEGCASELAQHFRRNEKLYTHIDAYAFERFVADVWRANYSVAEVHHIGKSHDRGFDVYYVDSEKRDWMIQVKRRESLNRSEGVDTIFAMAGALLCAGQPRGIVVTTASHFTACAIKNAKVNAPENGGKVIELVDRNALDRMLTPLLPDKPWRDRLQRCDDDVADWIDYELTHRRYQTQSQEKEHDVLVRVKTRQADK